MIKTLSNSGIITNDTIQAGHVTQSINALTGTEAYDITISGSLLLPGTTASGSFIGDGTGLTGITAEWDGSHVGNASITGSLTVTGGVSGSVSLNDGETIEALNGSGQLDLRAFNLDGTILLNTSASNYETPYLYMTEGLSGQVYLQGSNSNNYLSLNNNEITLATENELIFSGSSIRPFDILGTDLGIDSRPFKTTYSATGSFLHLEGNPLLSSTIKVKDPITFQSSITASGDISGSADIYGVTGSFQHLLGDGSGLTDLAAGSNGEIQFNNNGELFSNSAFIYKEGFGDFLVGDGFGNNTISGSSISRRLTIGDADSAMDGYKIDILNLITVGSKTPGIYLEGPTSFDSAITASSDISSSGTVYGVTGSFSHLQGNSPITVQDSITFQSAITASGDIITTGTIQAAGKISHLGDPNTGLAFSSDTVKIETNNFQAAKFSSTAQTIGYVDIFAGSTTTDIIGNDIGMFGDITIQDSITFQSSSAIFTNLPTAEPTTTGSVWISGSSVAHPNSGYLMIFNP